MKDSRKLKPDKVFVPPIEKGGDEIFRNGIFHFNISRILEDIHSGVLSVKEEGIDVVKWFKRNCKGRINEEHLASVVFSHPVIQAEISPGCYVIIDGNHRMEKALKENVAFIDSYKLYGEKLLPYLIDEKGYRAFIKYWNEKLEEYIG